MPILVSHFKVSAKSDQQFPVYGDLSESYARELYHWNGFRHVRYFLIYYLEQVYCHCLNEIQTMLLLIPIKMFLLVLLIYTYEKSNRQIQSKLNWSKKSYNRK